MQFNKSHISFITTFEHKKREDTPGTAGGPGGRDRTLAVKIAEKTSEKSPFFLKKIKFTFLHISSSYAKILGEKLFRTWEILRSGSKAKNREKRNKKEEREREQNLVITMAKLCMAHASTHGARKPPGPKKRMFTVLFRLEASQVFF